MSDPGPTLQWKRECTVFVGDSKTGKQLLAVSDLRIQFEITKTIGSTPNTALVKIYNLNADNEARIKGEFDEVLVNAGYKDASALVFAGNIRHTLRYRDETDYIMEIDAADGDEDLRNTIVNTTFAAGTFVSQEVDHLIGKFKRTKKGYVILNDRKRIRGRVASGMVRDVFDKIAAEVDAHWSIQDGKLEMVPVRSTLPTEAIVLRSDTGLLGAPEVDNKGIKATCLLNPRLRVNGKVWLDNNGFKAQIAKEREKKPGAKSTAKKKVSRELARTDPAGIYKIYKLIHKGDTRSNDWTTEVHCVALERDIPAGKRAA